MHDHHHHGHLHAHDSKCGDQRQVNRRRIALTLVLTLLYMVAEAVGGWWSDSLALLADAGHMFSDAAALGLKLQSLEHREELADRPQTSEVRRDVGRTLGRLLGLTRCVALEGAPDGVSCNAINPGFVATPQNSIGMIQQMRVEGVEMSLETYRRLVAQTIPQKRWIEATEIGGLAAFLCRDEAFGITGQDLTVAGGSSW